MIRRHRHSKTRLYELISRLPWWAGLLSALGAYALLHPIAVLQMPALQGTDGVATTAVTQLLVMLAQAGQYLVPLGFLMATAISSFIRWRQRDLRNLVTRDASGTLLRGLSRSDFEILVAEVFRDLGYKVTHPEPLPGSPCDLELAKSGRFYMVHYGSWKSSRLDDRIVRDLMAEIDASGADGGFIVSSGHFTPEAKHVAEVNGIEPIDGRQIKELIRPEGPSPRREPYLGMETFTSAARRLHGLADAGLDRAAAFAASALQPSGSGGAAAPERSRDSTPPSTVLDPVQEAMEATVGRKLTALLHSEDDTSLPADFMPPPAAPTTTPPTRQRIHRRFRPRLTRVVDLLGIAITSAGIWAGYQWFERLPEQPTHSPWDLLGTGSAKTVPDLTWGSFQGDATVTAPTDSDANQRPLGQLNYGGDWQARRMSANRPAPARVTLPEEEPVEEHHSVKELEAAFNRKYVPPPDCYQWETTADMARCGNHRIRARNAFIESRGRITPDMLGADGTQGGYPQPGDPVSDWRQEQAEWQDGYVEQPYAPAWQDPPAGEGTWGEAPGLGPDDNPPQPQGRDRYGYDRQELPQNTEGDWQRGGAWDQPRSGSDEQEWRQGSVPDRDWRQASDWRRREYSDRPGGWLEEQDGRQPTAPYPQSGWRENRP